MYNSTVALSFSERYEKYHNFRLCVHQKHSEIGKNVNKCKILSNNNNNNTTHSSILSIRLTFQSHITNSVKSNRHVDILSMSLTAPSQAVK